jgi:hypothetical protein
VAFAKHEALQAILSGKAVDETIPMFPCAPSYIRRYADIQRTVPLVRHDIDPTTLHITRVSKIGAMIKLVDYQHSAVMRGLDPRIHLSADLRNFYMDPRVKPAGDELEEVHDGKLDSNESGSADCRTNHRFKRTCAKCTIKASGIGSPGLWSKYLMSIVPGTL